MTCSSSRKASCQIFPHQQSTEDKIMHPPLSVYRILTLPAMFASGTRTSSATRIRQYPPPFFLLQIQSEVDLGMEGGNPSKLYVCRFEGASIAYGVQFARSIGDGDGHTHLGLSEVPDVVAHSIGASDSLFVIASDGVWDYLTEDDVALLILHGGGGGALEGAQRVVQRCVRAAERRAAAREAGQGMPSPPPRSLFVLSTPSSSVFLVLASPSFLFFKSLIALRQPTLAPSLPTLRTPPSPVRACSAKDLWDRDSPGRRDDITVVVVLPRFLTAGDIAAERGDGSGAEAAECDSGAGGIATSLSAAAALPVNASSGSNLGASSEREESMLLQPPAPTSSAEANASSTGADSNHAGAALGLHNADTTKVPANAARVQSSSVVL